MFDSQLSQITNNLPQVSVRSCGRLHFGLMEICQQQPNCYGGIGLMVQHSMGAVRADVAYASPSSPCNILASEYWRPRIDAVLSQWLRSHPDLPVQRIELLEAPEPHRGLGSGTQIACTVAAALQAAEICRTPANHAHDLTMQSLFVGEATPMAKLTELSQRGKRSNIGLRGFLEGGFIWDQGLTESEGDQRTSNSRTERFEFPDWPVLILQDNTSSGDFGKAECKMFEDCSKSPNPNRASMQQLVEQELIPSLLAADWHVFDKALGRYGRWAGLIFSPAQGGVYRTPKIEAAVELAHRLGIEGATQSSWGPTVCMFARDRDHAAWCSQELSARLPQWSVEITSASNGSAQVNL